jgi:c-di-GMP phosphodiesterase
MTNDIFLGRQLILDRDRNTFGYELLYRDGPSSTTLFDDPDDATRCVMERALVEWGMQRIVGGRFGFINASTSLIRSGLHRALPPEAIIFELREDEPFDDETMDALHAAREEGYHFALDNVSRSQDLRWSRALTSVSIVKVELTSAADDDVAEILKIARSRVPGVLIVAEKVESAQVYNTCFDRGFDLFQGHFFAKPELLRKAGRPAAAATALGLLADMQQDDISIDQIEQVVGRDPSLAFRLVGVVNSSAFGLDRRVDSLRQAIVLLGIDHVRRLTALLVLAATKNADEELITLGTVRARLASELIADRRLSASAFLVGLLSVTDAIYNTPMEQLVHDLPVSEEIAGALLRGEGPLGEVLAIARACETADLQALEHYGPSVMGGLERLQMTFGEAVAWAEELRQQAGVIGRLAASRAASSSSR